MQTCESAAAAGNHQKAVRLLQLHSAFRKSCARSAFGEGQPVIYIAIVKHKRSTAQHLALAAKEIQWSLFDGQQLQSAAQKSSITLRLQVKCVPLTKM